MRFAVIALQNAKAANALLDNKATRLTRTEEEEHKKNAFTRIDLDKTYKNKLHRLIVVVIKLFSIKTTHTLRTRGH